MDPRKILRALEKGVETSEKLGIKTSIAIVDVSGVQLGLVRMDGSFSVSPLFAFTKATTSATLGFPTSTLAQYAGEGKPYNGIDNMDSGKFTTIAGGVPVMFDGKLFAGVGVGGASDVNQDEQIAKSVAEALA